MERIKVRRGGKIVRVIENELAKYLSKGYVIVEDKKADEVQNTVPQKPIDKPAIKEDTTNKEPKKYTRNRKNKQ
jgi:hypothetical protein